MAEADVEAFLRKRVRLLGGYTIKLAPTERGIPDRLVFMPGGRMFLVELKSDQGNLSPIQKVWHTRINELGVPVYVLYSQTQIVEWLRQVVQARDPRSKPGADRAPG